MRSWRYSPTPTSAVSVLFSEPKIPQFIMTSIIQIERWRFSALQRAENSSILGWFARSWNTKRFQCSSASRKFLNRRLSTRGASVFCVSVLFSEPKIPQLTFEATVGQLDAEFQCSSASRKFLNLENDFRISRANGSFSALQRAENSSIVAHRRPAPAMHAFQCSSASRKFLNNRSRFPS